MDQAMISTRMDDRQRSIVDPPVSSIVTVQLAGWTVIGRDNAAWYLRDPAGYDVTLPLDAEGITFASIAPDWWPPRPGQIVRLREDNGTPSTRWVIESAGSLWFLDEHGSQASAEATLKRLMATGGTIELIDVVSTRIQYVQTQAAPTSLPRLQGPPAEDIPDPFALCQAAPFSNPHQFQADRTVADDWEVCGQTAGHQIHQDDDDPRGWEA